MINNTNSPNVCFLIPARAGSKGLRNKNEQEFDGSPLYVNAVRQALSFRAPVYLSTDIASAKDYFDDIPLVCIHDRPEHLATDEAQMSDVVIEVIKKFNLEEKVIVLLQPTTPQRTLLDIAGTISKFIEQDVDLVMTVSRTDSDALKLLIKDNGFRPISEARFLNANRQQLPAVFKQNGAVYVFRGGWLLKNKSFATNRFDCFETNELIDIDSQDDLDLVRERRRSDKA